MTQIEVGRSERREEIKLILEYFKLTVSLGVIISLLFAALQWKIGNDAADHNVHRQITSDWGRHLRIFIDKPELRPYFEGNKTVATDMGTKDIELILAFADIRLDTMDGILEHAKMRWGSVERVSGWTTAFRRAFRFSPVLCQRIAESMDNWGQDLNDIAKASCAK